MREMWERGDRMTIRIEPTILNNVDEVVYFGDEDTNGTWRIAESGDDLSVQKREAGVWVEKGAFQP